MMVGKFIDPGLDSWKVKAIGPNTNQLSLLKLILEQNGRLLEANIRLMELLTLPPIVVDSVDKTVSEQGATQ